MAQFILVYTHPSEGERRFELAPGRSYRLGSRPDNDIVIDQKDVSRRHAVLRVHSNSFHITDLDSKNGTFVNGTKTASETFGCGDMVHISSARVVIVEVGTGDFSTKPEAVVRSNGAVGGARAEETQKFRCEASMEDLVSLLEVTAGAVGRGDPTETLRWAVDHLEFDGAVVLYRSEDGDVAMVSSAGDLGRLASRIGELSSLVARNDPEDAAVTRVRQVETMGEQLLVTTVGSEHHLVIRYVGQPPTVGDVRSVIASISSVLAGNRGGLGGSESRNHHPAPEAELDADTLGEMKLADARTVFESWLIRRALDEAGGNQAAAARRLGLTRAGLFKKLRKLGI